LFDVTVHPRTYHHYPKGDGKWYWGRNGFVCKGFGKSLKLNSQVPTNTNFLLRVLTAAFDSASQRWYNCLYDGKKDNQDTYSQSLCTDPLTAICELTNSSFFTTKKKKKKKTKPVRIARKHRDFPAEY
jgi:hypothetical protein